MLKITSLSCKGNACWHLCNWTALKIGFYGYSIVQPDGVAEVFFRYVLLKCTALTAFEEAMTPLYINKLGK